MVEFWTLGTFALRTSEGREFARLLARPKCLAILAFLVAAGRYRFHSRDTLLGLFWPELDQEHARLALRQSIHVLRGELGEGVVVTRGALMIGVAEECLWCDAIAFEDALQAGNGDRAVELYRGDFLAGMGLRGVPEFERWLGRERTRLRARASAAAWALADATERLQSPAIAVHWARRAVDLAPDDEQGVRRLVALLDNSGNSAGALRLYDEFSRHLAAQYEAAPSPLTRSMAQAIRSRTRVVPGEPALVGHGMPLDGGYPYAARPKAS